MLRNFFHCTNKQFAARRNFVPERYAAGMRQWNQVETHFSPANEKGTTDDGVELFAVDKLHDGKAAKWNNKSRPLNFELGIHPSGTVADFIGCGNTIASAGRFAGKTANDGGKIDAGAHGGSIKAAEFLEPAKKRFTGSMSKWR